MNNEESLKKQMVDGRDKPVVCANTRKTPLIGLISTLATVLLKFSVCPETSVTKISSFHSLL